MKLTSRAAALVIFCAAATLPGSGQTPTFATGFNAAGPAVTVEGRTMMGWPEAQASGVRATGAATWSGAYSFPLSPAADAGTSDMLRSVLYSPRPFSLRFPLANGGYQVYLWMIENHQNNYRAVNVRLQNAPAASALGDLPRGAWRKYGPFPAAVTNGELLLELIPLKGDGLLAGMAIYRTGGGSGPGNQLPTVSLTAPANGGGYLAPANISLTASAQDPDGSIARVEFYNGGTLLGQDAAAPYSFDWNGVAAGNYLITAKAYDAAGASQVSAPASVTVGTPTPGSGQTSTFAAGFNAAGPAVTVEGRPMMGWSAAQASGVRATGAATWSGAHGFPLSPGADAGTSEMLTSVLYSARPFNLRIPLANGGYQVYLWMIENHRNNNRAVDVRLQNALAASAIGDLPLGAWRKYGPFPAVVSNGELLLELIPLKGDGLLAGMAVYRTGGTGPANQLPEVSLTAPANGASYLAPANIGLTASAQDPDGSIARVEFYNGGTLLGQDATAPYSFAWNGVAAGNYVLTAKAYDAAGAGQVSAPVPVTVSAPTSGSNLGPLRVSSNGRYFVKPNGDPFFWMSDTAWPLLTQYDCATAESYIDTRAAQGFNVILTTMAWNNPAVAPQFVPLPDCLGNPPFLNNSPATPNDAFFRRVEYLLRYAAQRGVTLAILPMWGSTHANRFFQFADMRPYGRYLGERFRNFPNLIWVNGGDVSPFQRESLFRELSEGLREGDPNHLISFHPAYGDSSGRHFHNESWFGFDMIQAWSWIERIPTLTAAGLARSPSKPTVMAEGAYEDGQQPFFYPLSPVTPLQIRRQAYWSLLSGAAGTTYGHTQTWTLVGNWLSTWETPGARQMTIYRNALEPHQWWTLAPDQSVIVSGAAVGIGYNAAARTANGSKFFVYVARPQDIGVNLAKIAAHSTAMVQWLDPRNGQVQVVGAFATSGSRVFTVPSGWEDGLLMVLGSGANSGDSIAPQVSFNAPLPNASLQGTITIAASATDNTGVAGVAFYLNDSALGSEVSSAPYQKTFDTTAFANGTYLLKAVARDVAGNLGVSLPVSVQIANSGTQPPSGAVAAINFGGPAVTVDGFALMSWDSAKAAGVTTDGAVFTGNYGFTLDPAASASARTMLQSLIWGPARDLRVNIPVANGAYQIYAWMMENNSNGFREVNLRLQDQAVATGLGRLPLGHWRRYGPYPASVRNGLLQVHLQRVAGDPILNAIAILGASGVPAGNAAPLVSLSNLVNGSSFDASRPVVMEAAAHDTDGSVARVEFYSGAVKVGEDTEAPYSFSWAPPAGSYSLTAKAIDDDGAAAFSAAVNVTVVPVAVAVESAGLRVSVNGRHLVKANGEPFLWVGDIAWPLFHSYTEKMAERYLDDRAARGFNVVMAALTWPYGNDGNPAGLPFRNNDPATPDEEFFARVDRIVEYARLRGITVAMAPAWGARHMGTIINPGNARAYGAWLGQRYHNSPNILWVLGGDDDPAAKIDLYRTLAMAIREQAPNHLMTFHSNLHASSSRWMHLETWLDFNLIHSAGESRLIEQHVRADRALTPVKPAIIGTSGPVEAFEVRRQAWWSLLAGAHFTYGHQQPWSMLGDQAAAMDSPGARNVTAFQRIAAGLPWHLLEPSATFLLAGDSTPLHSAAVATTGETAVVYAGEPAALTLDLTRLTGSLATVRAVWIDPATGVSVDAGSHAKAAKVFQTPAGWADALLVLTAEQTGVVE